jgi:predicted amidohydrolase
VKITLAQVKPGNKWEVIESHPIFWPELVTPTCINDLTGYGYAEDILGLRFNAYWIGDFVYRKNHLFPGYDDGRTAGTTLPHTYINGMKTYVVICYDLRFPELFAQMESPDLIIVPADWPLERMHHWDALLRARAIEGKCYVAGINTNGHSAVYNWNGDCLNELDETERLIEVEI